jgi:hypothetical protein
MSLRRHKPAGRLVVPFGRSGGAGAGQVNSSDPGRRAGPLAAAQRLAGHCVCVPACLVGGELNEARTLFSAAGRMRAAVGDGRALSGERARPLVVVRRRWPGHCARLGNPAGRRACEPHPPGPGRLPAGVWRRLRPPIGIMIWSARVLISRCRLINITNNKRDGALGMHGLAYDAPAYVSHHNNHDDDNEHRKRDTLAHTPTNTHSPTTTLHLHLQHDTTRHDTTLAKPPWQSAGRPTHACTCTCTRETTTNRLNQLARNFFGRDPYLGLVLFANTERSATALAAAPTNTRRRLVGLMLTSTDPNT